MRVRDMRLCAFAVLALLFAAPANAVTISPGNVDPVLLTPGNIYKNSNFTSLGAGLTDSYKFGLSVAPLGTISVTLNFPDEGPFQIAWFDSTSKNLTGYVSATVTPLVFALDPAGIYFLKVLNVGTATGDYLLRVTTTPLPPALILFGSALAGLTWLSRRRRRVNAAL